MKSERKVKQGDEFNVAVYRFIEFEKYLKEYKAEYDRVAITDIKDVYWFADGFQTIDPDELILMPESYEKTSDQIEHYTYRQDGFNDMWMKHCYGNEFYQYLSKNNKDVINVGFVVGNIHKMLKFLEVFNKEIRDNSHNFNFWGFDQAIMNYIVYSGKLKHIDIKYEGGTQRIGMDQKGGFDYDISKKKLMMKSSGCSPVTRHN